MKSWKILLLFVWCTLLVFFYFWLGWEAVVSGIVGTFTGAYLSGLASRV